jgi:hypothetical protein
MTPTDPLLQSRAAQLALRTPGPAARAALAALTGVPVTVCPPRTYALDWDDRPRCADGPPPPPRSRTARSDPRVVLAFAPNPKKPGTAAYARYALYATGRTCDELRRAGMRAEDFRYDVAHGFLQLGPPR